MTNALYALALQAAPTMPGWLFPLQLVLIGVVFWFLLIRPQSQARKKHAEMLKNLKKGDDVMTVGGLCGTVRDIKELKDKGEVRVTIETGTAQVIVERSRIVRIGDTVAQGQG